MTAESAGATAEGQAHAVQSAAEAGNDEIASLRQAIAPYTKPRLGRSLLDLATSVLPYLGLSVLMYVALNVSYALALVLAVPAAGFLLRTYIVFHDCAHGSFFTSKRANGIVGTVLGIIVFAPFRRWQHDHAVHHATSGDLDRRGVGDVMTLTVEEYHARSAQGQLAYRLFRSPFVMFTLGPIFALVIGPRLVSRTARTRMRRSVYGTNVALALIVGTLCWLIGWEAYLLVWAPPVLLAGATGVWLFYVQHQFEDAYWQGSGSWSFLDAALQGSSYLKLPKVLQYFTGNIGLHHVHHLSARVPNYNLQRAHDNIPVFQQVPILSLQDGLRAVKLKLYDEHDGRLVTFAEARAKVAAPAIASQTAS